MVTLEAIRQARERLKPRLENTPCVYSEALSELTGCRLFLKFENLHRTGSFKERGALNKLLLLSPEQLSRGVVTASAGNHGQALAYHASRLGSRAVVVMPEKTPLVKVSSTRRWGAQVVLHGKNYEEAIARAHEIEAAGGQLFVHGFDDEDVVAGQGTMTLELEEEGIEWDAMVIPIGGGGLIAGNAVAYKALHPAGRVFGVEPVNYASMQYSLEKGRPMAFKGRPSLADGLSVKSVGQIPFAIVREKVDEIFTVTEEEIANAILVLLEVEKTLVEGAGAAALAALLYHQDLREEVAGKRVLMPLCGGNIDVNVLSKIIDRGLAKAGRLGRFRVIVADQPGSLSEVTRLVAKAGGNILDIFHTRALAQTQVGEVAIDLVIETRGREHLGQLEEALREAGIRVEPLWN
jgi:threonine dehydratase